MLACPFGVPKYFAEIDQMLKCDMCYDRTSRDKKPMCATVCPSQALSFMTREEFEGSRRGAALSSWVFGSQPVRTGVVVAAPAATDFVRVEISRPAVYDVALLLEG